VWATDVCRFALVNVDTLFVLVEAETRKTFAFIASDGVNTLLLASSGVEREKRNSLKKIFYVELSMGCHYVVGSREQTRLDWHNLTFYLFSWF